MGVYENGWKGKKLSVGIYVSRVSMSHEPPIDSDDITNSCVTNNSHSHEQFPSSRTPHT